jgi:hypothetical protein
MDKKPAASCGHTFAGRIATLRRIASNSAPDNRSALARTLRNCGQTVVRSWTCSDEIAEFSRTILVSRGGIEPPTRRSRVASDVHESFENRRIPIVRFANRVVAKPRGASQAHPPARHRAATIQACRRIGVCIRSEPSLTWVGGTANWIATFYTESPLPQCLNLRACRCSAAQPWRCLGDASSKRRLRGPRIARQFSAVASLWDPDERSRRQPALVGTAATIEFGTRPGLRDGTLDASRSQNVDLLL